MSRRRRIKKRKSRKKLAYGVIAVTFILLGFLTYFSLQQSNQPDQTNDGNAPQVAIIDHLASTGQSNQTFINASIDILNEGGLTWKYYEGKDVLTVDFFRNLPSYATTLIILRQHSAIMRENSETTPLLGLFTSERYFNNTDAYTKYPEDIEDDRLVRAFFIEGGEEYFGIVPKFVEKSMKGRFEDTIIIMMGCQGLGYDGVTYTDMAEAFVNKGAKVYISWDEWVSVTHTDNSTLDLLQSLILENQTIREAVGEVDADPYFGGVLKYYPDNAGNYVIPNFRSSLTMNVAYAPLTLRAPKRSKYTATESGA